MFLRNAWPVLPFLLLYRTVFVVCWIRPSLRRSSSQPWISFGKAAAYIREYQAHGEIVTGLLYIDDDAPDLHMLSDTSETPLRDLEFEVLNPGAKILEEIQGAWS